MSDPHDLDASLVRRLAGGEPPPDGDYDAALTPLAREVLRRREAASTALTTIRQLFVEVAPRPQWLVEVGDVIIDAVQRALGG